MKILFSFALILSLNLCGLTFTANGQLAQNSGVTYRYEKVKITLLKGVGKVKISIRDEIGTYLFTDYIKIKEDVVYPINMRNVPSGKYLITISNKKEMTEHWVKIMPKIICNRKGNAIMEVIGEQHLSSTVRGNGENHTLKIFNKDL